MGYRFRNAAVVLLSFAATATLTAQTIASFEMSRDKNPAIAACAIVERDFNGAPMRIVANGWSSYISTAVQICINGDPAVDDEGCDSEGATSYVDTAQKLSNGTHELKFKLGDANGDVGTAQKNVTVN
jgi:hypothetical protein